VNLAHLIDDHAADSIALFSRGRPTTYGELGIRSARCAAASPASASAAAIAAIVCNNSRYFVVAYLAVLGLGRRRPIEPDIAGPGDRP
jgi:long-chain acyl-CoA synthetase